MYAIILCCDKYHIFAYHTILSYIKLWDQFKYNFTLRIPWNKNIPQYLINLQNQIKIEFIKTNHTFKDTIFNLTNDINDDQWIYWCSSDTYPIQLNNTIYIQTIHDFITENIHLNNNTNITGINFFPHKSRNTLKSIIFNNNNTNNNRIINIHSIQLLETEPWNNPKNFCLWLHQYMKCFVIKEFFKAFQEPNVAKNLDKQLYKPTFPIYKNNTFLNHKFYMTYNSLSIWGENTTRGFITINAKYNFNLLNIPIPNNFQIKNQILIWKDKETDFLCFLCKKNNKNYCSGNHNDIIIENENENIIDDNDNNIDI